MRGIDFSPRHFIRDAYRPQTLLLRNSYEGQDILRSMQKRQ